MAKELELTSWDSFKETCIVKKNLNCQYTETALRYDVYGPDSDNILWHTAFLKTNPRSADQIDFEDNHKAAFNFPIGSRPYAFSTSDYEFMPNMAGPDSCPPLSTKSIFFQITENCRLGGGKLITDGKAVFGDWVQCSLVDHNNILGYGIDFELKNWVPKWGIDWKSCTEFITTPYVGSPPVGFWLRLTYHSTGPDPVGFLVNFILHRPI